MWLITITKTAFKKITWVLHARFILLLFFPQLNTLFPDLPSINFYPAIDIVKRDFAFSTSDRMRHNAPLSCLLLKQNRKTVSRSPVSLSIHHRFSHGRQSLTQPLMPFVMMCSVMPGHDFTEAGDDQRWWQHDQTRGVDHQSFRYHAYQISDAQNFREHQKTANWERYPTGPANLSQSLIGNPMKISTGPRNQRMILRTELIQRQRRTARQRVIFTQQTNILLVERSSIITYWFYL